MTGRGAIPGGAGTARESATPGDRPIGWFPGKAAPEGWRAAYGRRVAHLLTLARVAALLAAGWLAVRLAVRASAVSRTTLGVAGDRLVVRFGKWDALLTQRRSLSLDVTRVAGVRVVRMDPVGGLPIWGLSLPGGVRAGTFIVDGRREFWNVRGAGDVLEVTLRPGPGWSRLVLQPVDPAAAARALRPHAATLVPGWL